MSTQELEEKMTELRYDRIFLCTQLSVETEAYFKNPTATMEKLTEIRYKIAEIDMVLLPLQEQYEKQFIHYYMRFTASVPDMYGNKSSYTYQQQIRSKIDYDINTTVTPIDWRNDNKAKELLKDLAKDLVQTYGEIRIDVIAKIKRP